MNVYIVKYISCFPISVIRHHDQGNSQKKKKNFTVENITFGATVSDV